MKMFIPVVSVLCITLIEIVALNNNIDGALMSASFVAIGGICGYWVKALRKK